MPLPTSGPLTLADIQTEFGGSNPISLSEYYAGGAYVPAGTSGTNGAVPSSGTISVWNFYGTSALSFFPAGGTSAGSPQPLAVEEFWPATASILITCSQSATWVWSSIGTGTLTSTVASGGSNTSIQFTLTGQFGFFRQRTITLSGTAAGVTRYWSIDLIVDGAG